MTDAALLLALCQKLGHGLEEVRIRALDSLLSKIDRGFLQITDLIATKDFLVKLLEWFGLQPCRSQDRVLGLIYHILKEEGSTQLVAQIGAQRILLALNTIRENLPSELCPLLDDIAGLVHRAQVVQEHCEGEIVSNQKLLHGPAGEPCCGPKSGSSVNACVQDASLEEALQENFESHDSTEPVFSAWRCGQLGASISSNVLKNILLPWQPLISTDRHVLIAVESSLSNTLDRIQLLNTCSFLTDVMMRDFPAEVFLQRPAIVMTFMKLMEASLKSGDKQLAKTVIICLLTLTNALQCRLRFYLDPNVVNQKQESFLNLGEDAASHMSAESLLSDLGEQVDVEGLKRIPEWNNFIQKNSGSQTLSHSTPPSFSEGHNSSTPCSESQAPTDSAVSEKSSMLRLQQCSVPQFSLLTMRHVIPHVDMHSESTVLLFRLSLLLTSCVTPQIWLAPSSDLIATDIATHLYEVLAMLGELLLKERIKPIQRLVHLQLLAITRHLLQHLVPLEVADRCLPRQMKSALCATLLDGPLHAFFPSLHSDLRQYTQMLKNVRDVDCVKLFESTLSVAESLSSAAKLLSQDDLSDGSKVVLNMECALTSLAFHQDYRFIPLVFDSCFKNYHRWHLTESEHNTATSLMLKFLAHADQNVRRNSYSHLHKVVLEGLSVQHSVQSPAEFLAFLLYSTPLLLEITTHGIASSDELVQNCAEDIILHALKGRFLLGSTHWTQFLSALEPVLPLLQCWCDKPSALGRSILTVLNPDVGSQMSLGTTELLKGNLRLMFSKADFVRKEAFPRLIWLLTKEEDAFHKLPHIATLHNCATDTICLVEKPVDVFRHIPEQSFYQESSLMQVLEIMESSGLDPRILLSAVTQVAAMLEDPRHHETFLSRGGLNLSIEYLHAAVSDKRYEIYPEVVVPIVSILRSLSLHHTISRHQLSKNTGILYSTLRGLIMFPSDLRLRASASQLLAVLLYNDVIISASPCSLSDGFVVRCLSVPLLIDSKMRLPIVFQTHWKTSHFTEPLMTDVLLRHEECRKFLSIAWNLSYFQTEQSPLLWMIGKNPPRVVSDALRNFSSSLLLNDTSLQILQASALLNLSQKQLINIQESSTHSDVTKSLDVLKSIISLYNIIKGAHHLGERSSLDVQHFQKLYKTLPWHQTFRRFLVAAPASLEDQQLLIEILQFLRMHAAASYSLGLSYKDGCWLSKQLQHPSQPLPNLFHTVAHTGYAGDNVMPHELAHLPKWKLLCKELLGVITECVNFEQHLGHQNDPVIQGQAAAGSAVKENNGQIKNLKKNKSKSKPCTNSKRSSGTELERADEWVEEVVSSAADGRQLAQSSNWTHVIQNIVSCLKSSDTQHFYNLAYLDWLLWALTHLTSKQGWSCGLRGSQLKTVVCELLAVLLELAQAFHLECGKGGSSYMGLSITRASILCLNHLLDEAQQCKELKWEELWFAATRKASRTDLSIPWLPSLFRSREPLVRAAALQLAAGTSLSVNGCRHAMSMLAGQPDVWLAPLCILLDRGEASIVREQAANLLVNLVRFSKNFNDPDNTDFENSRYEFLHQRLMEGSFLSETWSILDCISLATHWDANHFISEDVGIGLMHWSLAESENGSRNLAHLPSNQCIIIKNHSNDSDPDFNIVPCTPSLIRSLCNLLKTVADMNCDILKSYATEGLSAQLLRCIRSVPPVDFQNKRAFQLYCDTLSMYSSLCHVVSMCISREAMNCWFIPQQPQTYHKLLLLLDPTLFYTEPSALLHLRNELWTEVLWLISSLISSSGADSCQEESGHSVFHSLLIRSRGEPLASVLSIALSGSMITDLQRAALACVQSLLSHPASAPGQPFAVLLDDIDADFNSSFVAVKETNVEDSIGAVLCRHLLALYEVHSLQMGSVEKSHPGSADWQAQRVAVAGALSSVVEVSIGAKEVAVNRGLVELLCAQLGAIQSHLILEPGETMKRLATKKKVCPVLQDLNLLLGLLNSILLQNKSAKELASDVGVTDTVHKLWTWCLAQPNLLLNVLKFLGTLTSGCETASHSLVLTTSVPGLGLRRTPSSQSLLHSLVALILQETEASTGSHDLTIMMIASSVLCNACHVPECRIALTKSNLLQGIHHLHSGLSKRSKQKKQVEKIWLTLLVQLSSYQEGQVVLPKIPDLLDCLLHLAEGQKKNNKLALQVLRNVSFNPINRPRMLGCGGFLLLVNKKLREGDTDEQVAVAAALWALVANNQKGKLTAKCSGTDVHLLDALRQLAVGQRPGADFVAQLLNCVLKIIRHEPGIILS